MYYGKAKTGTDWYAMSIRDVMPYRSAYGGQPPHFAERAPLISSSDDVGEVASVIAGDRGANEPRPGNENDGIQMPNQ